MLKRYEAKKTCSFSEGQALADFVEGRYYKADRQKGYAINEFDETIAISQEVFEDLFRLVKISRAGNKTKKKYRKTNTTQLYITLFNDADRDIIEHLEKMTTHKYMKNGGRAGKSEYIRNLIRADILRRK